MKSFRYLIAVSFCLIAWVLQANSATWHVATNGNNSAAGTNWVTAKATIQAGINVASSGDVVQVSNGVYLGTGNRDLVITNKVLEVVSVAGASSTIIDCGATRVMTVQAASNLRMVGFTIRNAYLAYGGDWGADGLIRINSSKVAFEGLVVISNTTYTSYPTSRLSVIDAQSSTVTVQNCLIACNKLDGQAMSIYGAGSDVVYSRGESSFIRIDSSSFTSNNFGSIGFNWVVDVTEMRNSIVHGNGSAGTPSQPSVRTNRPSAYVAYSCVEGGFMGVGNITNNPIFLEPYKCNFRLRGDSRCIDRGNSGFAQGIIDLDGKCRVLGSAVDMGAYEFEFPSNSILGSISYFGGQVGNIIVYTGSHTVDYSAIGNYWLQSDVYPGACSVFAYMDSNGNGTQDYWEANGSYSNNPIYLTNSTIGVNITLIDPDHDGDGQSDFIELMNGTNPYDSLSFESSIAGHISYTGLQTGNAYITLTQRSKQTEQRVNSRALSLSGYGYVDVSNSPSLDLGTNLTFMLWVMPCDTNAMTIFDNGVCSYYEPSYNLWLQDHVLMKVNQDDNNMASRQSESLGKIKPWVWTHIACAYDGNVVKYYINGCLDSIVTISNVDPHIPHHNLWIGKLDSGGIGFRGMIDDLSIWGRDLSQEEIQAMMNIGPSGSEAGIRACWNFDDGTAHDQTTNHNDGVFQGDASTTNGFISDHFASYNAGNISNGIEKAYIISNLYTLENYYITAFVDSDGSGARDDWEACGAYNNSPLALNENTNGINITLTDPDHDEDGQPDYVERQNGTDPYNVASRVETFSGHISEVQGQTSIIPSIGSYSYITNPSSPTYSDSNYSKLTDGVAVVPVWGGSGDADVNSLVGWLNVNPSISFGFSSRAKVSEIRVWAADSDNSAGVGLPSQITVSTTEGYNRSFSITNPAGSGNTVELSLKDINTLSDRFVVTATRGSQWTMFSEVQFQFCAPTLRVVAMLSPLDSLLKSSDNMQYSTVVTGGCFSIQEIPTLSNYWVKAFIDSNNDGVWSPFELIGSFAENPIYFTNDFSAVNISLGYGDWDGDGIPDDEEAFVLHTVPSNPLSPIQVDDNGSNDPGPGDPNISDPLADGTRYHPYDSIQKGINAATNGMTVLVMDGYYTSTGNRDIQLNGKRITVRSRNGADHVHVEDFTRGFICNSNETTNTVIQGFSIHTWSSFFGLEGIRCDGASPAIRDCNIWDCGIAGILCTNGANPVIERCVVNGNAGGVRIFGSSPTFERCTIVSNNSDLGAGIYISGSSKPTIQNCLIANNTSSVEGGGLYIGAGSSPTNINCTIAGNSAVTRGGGVSSGGSPVFYNDIVYNNTAPASTGIYASAAMTVQYSCLQSFYPGLGNKTNNPNLNTGDGYKLTAGSVAIDAGTVAFMPAVDLLGVPRPVDGDTNGTATVDMGCYEFIPQALDSDADGVPDWWTWQYFGHLSGQGSDYSFATTTLPGSRMTTYEKYLAGLDPTNPASVLAVTGVQWLPQGVKVDWEGGQTVKQYVESKSDLGNTNEPWTPVFTNLPPTSITTNVTVNVGTTNKAGFYRIRVER